MWGCPAGTTVPYNSRTKVPSQYQQTLVQDTASHPRRPASHKHCCAHIISHRLPSHKHCCAHIISHRLPSHKHCCAHIISHRLLNILTVLNHWLKQNQNFGVLTKFNFHFKQVQSPNFFDNLATAILVLTHRTLKFIIITFKKSIPTSTKKNALPLQRPNDYCCIWK